jgi:hypothetical protein
MSVSDVQSNSPRCASRFFLSRAGDVGNKLVRLDAGGVIVDAEDEHQLIYFRLERLLT